MVSVNGGRGRVQQLQREWRRRQRPVREPAGRPAHRIRFEEFRVLTNTFDAEYGRNSGAVVNVVTKSGTNQFHGNVYEFFRNKVLNSRGYFDIRKARLQQNQFGGTFGGPIKKDRTFFFASYEGRRIRRGISSDAVTMFPRPTSVPARITLFGVLSTAILSADRSSDKPVADSPELVALGCHCCSGRILIAAGDPTSADDFSRATIRFPPSAWIRTPST